MGRPRSTSKTCANGHERTPANTETIERCRCCHFASVARFRAKRRATATSQSKA
jgi:hypothetical protein